MPDSYHTDCVNFDKLRSPLSLAVSESQDLNDIQQDDQQPDQHDEETAVPDDEYYTDDDIFEQFLDLHVSIKSCNYYWDSQYLMCSVVLRKHKNTFAFSIVFDIERAHVFEIFPYTTQDPLILHCYGHGSW